MVHETPMLLIAPPLEHHVAEALCAAEGAVHHVDRRALELAEDAEARAADVRAPRRRSVAEEAGVDHA